MGCYQASAALDDEPIIRIRRVGAGKTSQRTKIEKNMQPVGDFMGDAKPFINKITKCIPLLTCNPPLDPLAAE